MSDDLTSRAIQADIAKLDDAITSLTDDADHITLKQFRRIKELKNRLDDLLVKVYAPRGASKCTQ